MVGREDIFAVIPFQLKVRYRIFKAAQQVYDPQPARLYTTGSYRVGSDDAAP
jgi:hypothetical protein